MMLITMEKILYYEYMVANGFGNVITYSVYVVLSSGTSYKDKIIYFIRSTLIFLNRRDIFASMQ